MYQKVSVKERTQISENIRWHLGHLGHLTGSGGERGQQAFTVSPSTQSAVTWSLQEKTLITNFVSFLYHVCNFLNKERENPAENLDQRAFIVISNKVSSEKSPHPLSSFYIANEQGTQNSKNICWLKMAIIINYRYA